jgi:hypothetical protein
MTYISILKDGGISVNVGESDLNCGLDTNKILYIGWVRGKIIYLRSFIIVFLVAVLYENDELLRIIRD